MGTDTKITSPRLLSEDERTEPDLNLCAKPRQHWTGSCLSSLKGSLSRCSVE